MSESLATILLSAGIAFVAAAILGGGLKAFQVDIPAIAKTSRQLLLGGFGTVLIVVALLGGSDGSQGPARTASADPSDQRVEIVPGPGQPAREPATGSNSASSPQAEDPLVHPPGQSNAAGRTEALTDCTITIGQPLVPLRREPQTFSTEVMRIPIGSYRAQAYARTSTAVSEQGWFAVTVGDRSGWVRDHTWDIARKTSGCP